MLLRAISLPTHGALELAAGLAVAVTSLVTYNYFQRRIEVMAVEMESLVADLVVKCYPPGETPVVESVR